MAQSAIKVERESDVTPTADFDDETLKAKAKDLKNKGNEEYGKKEYSNALRFYTEGIKVNCKDDELTSQLYNNRATANFYLGNFRESLNDAKAAIKLQPTYIKAIARGASACLELHLYEEANTWCEKGLAINKKDKTLSSLKARSLDEMKKLRLKGRQEMKDQERTDLLHKATGNAEDRAKQEKLHDSINKCPGDFKRAIHYHERDLKTAKESGDKAIERRAYWNLGNCYLSLSDYKKAIYYHELYLENAKKDKDRTDEGIAYCCLGNDYQKLGDFRKAIAFHEFHLNLAKEIGDRVGEGKAYGNLGNNYANLAYFKKAKDYLELQLDIAIQLGDRNGEQMAYFGLGGTFYALGDLQTATYYDNLYLKMAKERNDRVAEGQFYSSRGIQLQNLGDYRKAIHCHNIDLKLALEVGDKTGAAMAYCELGTAYQNLGDFKKAIEYSESCLKIAQEVGNRDAEGKAYCNLATTYRSLGDLKKAVNYGELSLKSAKELGNRDREYNGYSILGDCYESLVESKKAIACHEVCLNIAIEMGNRSAQASTYSHLADSYHSLRNLPKAIELRLLSMKMRKDLGKRPREHINYYRLGCSYESLGDLTTAADCYRSSLRALNDEIRLQQDDECKISLRNMYRAVHTSLWQVLLKQEKEIEALTAAEQGRAQALKDLMKSKYGLEESSTRLEETAHDLSLSNSSSTIYIAYDEKKIVFWVSQNRSAVCYRSRTIMSGDGYHALEDMTKHFQSLVQTVSEEIGVRAGVKCEDRSLDNLRDETVTKEKLPEAPETRSHHSHLGLNALKKLYDLIIGSLRDLLHGQELIIVPEGPLCLAPFAALVDSNSKYLSESFRIRVIPSLTSLKLITDCPGDYHCKTGALLVGDPWVQEFTYQGRKLHQLPCAREEVEMIGRILNTEPLIGTAARKDAVLQRLCSVALVHIAAHGRMETGEIALAPNSTRKSGMPKEEDFLLTMKDVLSAKLRARLVVLSCCHSGRGEIKSEGVVGIARAFLGAGARSVLVSLWAIDDQATLEFMKRFYEQLVKGSSASAALNQAMKLMRESDDFNEVKYWAPFVLIGDDVTLDWNLE